MNGINYGCSGICYIGVTENGGVILCSAIPDHSQNILWGFNWMHGYFNRENKYESQKPPYGMH